jgi:hypothetical protein
MFLLLAIVTNLSFRPEPGLVYSPTFSPPSQSIPEHEHLTVMLGCATEGSTIHYTTDGTVPDENSAPYTTPLRVEPGTTIKAIALREKWTPSVVAVGPYPLAGPTTATAPSMVMPSGMPAAPVSAPVKPEPATPAAPVAPVAPATAPATK